MRLNDVFNSTERRISFEYFHKLNKNTNIFGWKIITKCLYEYIQFENIGRIWMLFGFWKASKNSVFDYIRTIPIYSNTELFAHFWFECVRVWKCESVGVWECESLKVWKFESARVWNFESARVCECENVRVWKC